MKSALSSHRRLLVNLLVLSVMVGALTYAPAAVAAGEVGQFPPPCSFPNECTIQCFSYDNYECSSWQKCCRCPATGAFSCRISIGKYPGPFKPGSSPGSD